MKLQKIIIKEDQILDLEQVRNSNNLEILVQKEVSLIVLDKLKILNKTNTKIIQEKDSLLEYFLYGNIKKTCTCILNIVLKGENSQAKIRGGFLISDKFTIDIKQDHLADYTKSDLLLKTGLLKNSKLSFNGIAFVNENCRDIVVNQYNKNMILGNNTEILSKPCLEILSKDACCKHGSASSPLWENDIFYMSARGLSKFAVNKLLINGFLKEVLPMKR